MDFEDNKFKCWCMNQCYEDYIDKWSSGIRGPYMVTQSY